MAHGPIDGVIFDLDGVIVDSEIWWDEVRRTFAAEHGRWWTIDDRHAVMGANSRQWSEIMRRRLDLEIPAADIERIVVDRMVERYAREGPPSIDGAVYALRRIASGRPAALASSSHRAVIDAALEATGLDEAFGGVVSSDEVAHGKPAPDVFLEAARRIGVPPDRILVVEDSLNGVLAAKAAGMAVALVPNHSVPPAAGAAEAADVVVDRISDLDLAAVPSHAGDRPAAASAAGAASASPGADHRDPFADTIHPLRRTLRTLISRFVAGALCRALFRLALIGRERLPAGPAIYCSNHLSWIDPFVVMATLPMRPRLMFFGPKEEDMSVGGRNRLMQWTGATIPYRPGKNDLLEATRRVHSAIAAGRVVVIFGEGRIQPFESHLGPLSEGAAYFALRERVPLVPFAIHGTSWLRFGGRIEVEIGAPLAPEGRPGRATVDALTDRCRSAIAAMTSPRRELSPPGRFGRWLTELFNDWPEGSREAAEAAERERAGTPGQGP